MRAGLERQPGNERWAEVGGWWWGGAEPWERLRYKQVNDFLLALRSFPHLTAWKGLWRGGLERRPSLCVWCRRTAQIPTLLLAPLAKLLEFRVLISVVNHIWSEDDKQTAVAVKKTHTVPTEMELITQQQ